jgi:hypothetical protein
MIWYQFPIFEQNSIMFKSISLPLILMLLIIASCSSDDDMGNAQEVNKDYFPLVVDNSWSFFNETTTADGSTSSSETMNIASEEMLNDTLFFQAETDNNTATITTTSILSGGELFKEEGKLMIKGQFGDLISSLPAGLSLPVEANIIPIYSKNAGANAELFAESGSFTETVNDLNLSMDFTLSSQNLSVGNSMEVDGTTYQDVLSANVTLNMQITASPGDIPFTITVLDQQDVFSSTHHFANEVGIIKSEIATSFDFEELPDIDLPDVNTSTVQELGSSNVILP